MDFGKSEQTEFTSLLNEQIASDVSFKGSTLLRADINGGSPKPNIEIALMMANIDSKDAGGEVAQSPNDLVSYYILHAYLGILR